MTITIKRLREKFKLTHEQLASHLGVNEWNVQRYEGGNLTVPPPVARLAQLLNEKWNREGYSEPEDVSK